MEEIDLNLIERYLANDLSEKERADFEQRRKEDALFNQEIADYENAKEALMIKQRDELRLKIKGWDQDLDAPKQDVINPKKFRHFWLAIAAILVLALLLWWFKFTPDHPAVPVNTDGKDSLTIDKPNVVDSISPPKEKPEDQKEKEHQPDMADAAKKGAELFADNFTPYKDKSMSPVSRGDNDLSPIDQFRTYYWNGRYKEAIKVFSTLGPQYQNNDNLRFVYANAVAVEGDYEVAQLELVNIINHKKSIYLDEAQWYLGLLYMQQGDMTNAGKYFKNCVIAVEGKHKKEAKDLLEKIK